MHRRRPLHCTVWRTGRSSSTVRRWRRCTAGGGAHYKYILRTFWSGLLSAAELAFLPLLFLVWLTTRLICLPRNAGGGSLLRKFWSHLPTENKRPKSVKCLIMIHSIHGSLTRI